MASGFRVERECRLGLQLEGFLVMYGNDEQKFVRVLGATPNIVYVWFECVTEWSEVKSKLQG